MTAFISLVNLNLAFISLNFSESTVWCISPVFESVLIDVYRGEYDLKIKVLYRKPISLLIIFTDPISGVTITGPTATLIAGNSTANLSCQATAGTVKTTTWLKDGTTLTASPRVVFSEDMRSLMINPLQKEDNGEYKCQLKNPVNQENASYRMVVNCECLFH